MVLTYIVSLTLFFYLMGMGLVFLDPKLASHLLENLINTKTILLIRVVFLFEKYRVDT